MTARPRWVVDTNVLVSAFLWQGTPGRVIEMAGDQEVQLFTSRTLLDELAATLGKKKLAKYVAATGTSDEDLLVLKQFNGVPIVTVRQAIQAVAIKP